MGKEYHEITELVWKGGWEGKATFDNKLREWLSEKAKKLAFPPRGIMSYSEVLDILGLNSEEEAKASDEKVINELDIPVQYRNYSYDDWQRHVQELRDKLNEVIRFINPEAPRPLEKSLAEKFDKVLMSKLFRSDLITTHSVCDLLSEIAEEHFRK